MKIEIVSKSLYSGSGPRGVDVYARHLFDELSKLTSTDTIKLSKDKASGNQVDVIHYTFFDPFYLTLFGQKTKPPFVVTVHDLIPLVFENQFSIGIRGKIKWLFQKRALRRSAAIITDSQCSKTDIVKLVGVNENKVYVIPLAAGHTIVNDKLVKTVRSAYNLPDIYLLYVGDINWNKNISGLIEAFSTIQDRQTHLVLVGKAFESSKNTTEYHQIREAIEKSGKSELIHMLGFVPSHHLPAIYKAATLYVQPSWYEGFGFPILEAMEQGTPVASSAAGSLREVGGQYAHYFDPNVKGEMGKLLSELLKNSNSRKRYVDSGKSWAKSFTWDKVIKKTRAVYASITG